jgi:uncharacterized repeat protein (TIGR03803 family)
VRPAIDSNRNRFRAPSAIAALTLVLAATPSHASNYTFKKLYSLCGKQNCTDGQFPDGQLLNVGGTLYGTAAMGGKYNNDGVVFALKPKAGQYDYSVIHDFCKNSGCPDGATSVSDLIADVNGNLYGTAGLGGKHKKGVVFSLTKNGSGWTYKVLHSFCGQSNCADGEKPATGLSYQGQAGGAAWNKTSPLFGTTTVGGVHGNGVVFELTLNGSQWSYTVIHDIISGQFANAPLVDTAGNLFINSALGGSHDGGNLYKLDSGIWHETTIHNFCAETNCTDGYQPQGRLALDSNGNVFGVTFQGGAANSGVVFEHPTAGGYSVVYNFCSAGSCADGGGATGLTFVGGGTFFGATQIGGANNGGTVFKLTSKSGNLNETVIHDFCGNAHCADGYAPAAAPIEDASGNLFGATIEGGHTSNCPYGGGCGTVFELTP